jgi:hypothetical protein
MFSTKVTSAHQHNYVHKLFKGDFLPRRLQQRIDCRNAIALPFKSFSYVLPSTLDNPFLQTRQQWVTQVELRRGQFLKANRRWCIVNGEPPMRVLLSPHQLRTLQHCHVPFQILFRQEHLICCRPRVHEVAVCHVERWIQLNATDQLYVLQFMTTSEPEASQLRPVSTDPPSPKQWSRGLG